MSRRLPNLTALRAFEAAARNLSFSRAAEELHVTQSAISRQIKALEQYLGVSLFKRLTRAVELTEDAKIYLPVARQAFDSIEEATVRLIGGPKREILTISVLPTLGIRWLTARLMHFADENPDIEVRVITTIKPANFKLDDIDLAIRVGTLPQTTNSGSGPRIDLEMVEDWTDVQATWLMPDVMMPVCGQEYLNRTGNLSSVSDLSHHVLLHTTTRLHAWPDWLRAAGVEANNAVEGPAFGHFFMTLQAAIENRGIALIPHPLAEDDLNIGRVIKPLNVTVQSAGSYYLLCRKRQWSSHGVRKFRHWLRAEVGQTARLSTMGDVTKFKRVALGDSRRKSSTAR